MERGSLLTLIERKQIATEGLAFRLTTGPGEHFTGCSSDSKQILGPGLVRILSKLKWRNSVIYKFLPKWLGFKVQTMN